MLDRRLHLSPAEFLRRLFAAGCVALVLLLGTLAASPELHERFHAGTDHDGDDGCAVVLFASGVSLAVDAVIVPSPVLTWGELVRTAVAEIFLASPRYLHQPERGPPLS